MKSGQYTLRGALPKKIIQEDVALQAPLSNSSPDIFSCK